MMLVAAIFIALVLIVDLIVDMNERFSFPKKKKSVWVTVWWYTLLIVLNLLAIGAMSLVVLEETT